MYDSHVSLMPGNNTYKLYLEGALMGKGGVWVCFSSFLQIHRKEHAA